MENARGKRQKVIEIFQSVWLAGSLIYLAILFGILSIIILFPIEKWLNLNSFGHNTVILLIVLLGSHLFLTLQCGFLNAGFRFDGDYGKGTFFQSMARLFEYSALSLSVYLYRQPVLSAAAMLISRCIFFIIMKLQLQQQNPWLKFGFKYAKFSTANKLILPALALTGLPLGNSVNNQGILAIISSILGPVYVTIFSTTKTLSNLVFQSMNVIRLSVWPEISAAYGSGNLLLARKLYTRSCQISFWLSLSLCLSLALLGDLIFKLWVGKNLTMDTAVFQIMLAIIVFKVLWFSSSVILTATNKHKVMTSLYCLFSITFVLFTSKIVPLYGLKGAALSTLCVDILMCIYVLTVSGKQLGLKKKSMIKIFLPI